MRRRLAFVLVAVLVALAAAGATLGAVMAPATRPSAALGGFIRAPGGAFLYDRSGRVVILHGVNVVYKHAPYEVYPDRAKPWNFSVADARRIARLGFDVVRLGIEWEGLEPGTAPSNDPKICKAGKPANPHQLNVAVLTRYLDRLQRTVNLLARYHVYTLIDMHQDLYSSVLGGEGAPRWAVCTDGAAPTRPPGRWSRVYETTAFRNAVGHFWANDVVGDLQGQFDEVWGYVARFFSKDRWVVGYDPYNEPFSMSVHVQEGEALDSRLECFYAGRADIARKLPGTPAPRCPADDPRTGVIPTILHNAPHQLVFDEPDIFTSADRPSDLGPMDFHSLVYNVHIYCSDRSPVTGNPHNVEACAAADERSLARREDERAGMASPAQPKGPAWFVSEFGATSNASVLRLVTAAYDRELVGWTYWSWKYYDDPTGSADEALVARTGRLRASAKVLSQTYAEAIAGTPLSMSFDPTTGRFLLRYRARRTKEPTLVVVASEEHYPDGYCVHVAGGEAVGKAARTVLEIANRRAGHLVDVTIAAGRCSAGHAGRRRGAHLPR